MSDNSTYYRLGVNDGGWFVGTLQEFDERNYDVNVWACDHKFRNEDDVKLIIKAIHHWAATSPDHSMTSLWLYIKNTGSGLKESIDDITVMKIVDAAVSALGQAMFRHR